MCISIIFDLHKKLKLAIQNNKRNKIILILGKLKNFNVTINQLEITLIGRTVNSLQKIYLGKIKTLASKLIKIWKLKILQHILLDDYIKSTERIRV